MGELMAVERHKSVLFEFGGSGSSSSSRSTSIDSSMTGIDLFTPFSSPASPRVNRLMSVERFEEIMYSTAEDYDVDKIIDKLQLQSNESIPHGHISMDSITSFNGLLFTK